VFYGSLTAVVELLNYRGGMRNTLRRWLISVIAACSIAALNTSAPAGSALDRESLDTLFARYDREPDGPAKDQLAARIDALSHQKYATVSRLYWHVDLASAKAAAREQGRPILHLRMLGRLDEDLSCANSRLFRATLYANQDVSQFLREQFVLYWSSERPVPRVTIDYGDGRRLERTITGNSAHYVLDEDGEVLDVLPGLYAPAQFRHELERIVALAAQVRHLSSDARASLLANHHQQRMAAAERDWTRLAGVAGSRDLRERLTPQIETTEFVAAQLTTVSKSGIELRKIRSTARELAPEAPVDNQMRLWSLAGERLYRTAAPVLDDQSRALVARLHNAGPRELGSTNEELNAMIARLERTIVADTALNQLQLRPQIAREIVRRGGRVEVAALNAWIYDQVFRTPRQDAWLGLLQRDVFTGVPGDGVVLRNDIGKR
jgi:hypothetical protein